MVKSKPWFYPLSNDRSGSALKSMIYMSRGCWFACYQDCYGAAVGFLLLKKLCSMLLRWALRALSRDARRAEDALLTPEYGLWFKAAFY